MELLYISSFMFEKENEHFFGLPSCADAFFKKYLDVFDSIKILGENIKPYLNNSSLVEIKDERIKIRIIKGNTHPKDFKNDLEIKKILKEEILNAKAILIKPSSRKGMMAIEIANKANKPYMIEMTGDIHNAMKQNPSFFKRCYSSFLYRNIKRHIKKCRFGLYVSENYLQNKYPIQGEMCGCSDVILEKANEKILKLRFEKINNSDFKNDIVKLALIGFYQGKMKGIDCAIRALSHLPSNYHLFILGNGTERNRNKWFDYANSNNVKSDRIHFPEPLLTPKAVCNWLDTMDMFVFPTHSEGFSRAVVEAMSRGLPCFASNVCAMPELLEKEHLFEIDDDSMLAKLILTESQNKEELFRISKRNFEKAKDYDFDVLSERRNRFLRRFKEYCESGD